MSVRSDIINLNVNINGDAGKKELNDLRSKAAQLTAEMKGMKKSSQEYQDKMKELTKVKDRMTELKKEIGLTSLSQRELNEELRRLQAQKNFLTPQTAEFKKLQKEINAVQNRLKEVRTGKFGFKAFWGGIKDEVKQFGMLAAGYLGFDFLIGQTKNIIQMQANMSREYADIQKTTSLSVEQVKQLDKELRKLDSPTSNSRLRQMAAEAGKLGIDGVEDIKKFVDEADKIQVALGEDLGEEGLIKIAKLSGILKEGMLNIASGINAVGQASAASESYQVDFSFRMAGTAQTARIAAGDLLGYAAALEVNGQTAEVSGTALSSFMLDFIAKTESFGAAAGFAKGELSKLVNEKGVNEAFLQFLQRMKDGSKTTDDFINKMKALGIDGARGAGVFLVMANNIEEVRKQQLLANEAVQAGTSVLDEFEVRNQSFDAVVKRLGKTFNSFFTNDSINAGVKKLVYALEGLLRFLSAAAKFIAENANVAAIWTAAVILQTGALKKLVIWIASQIVGTKISTYQIALNTIALRAKIVAALAAAAAQMLLAGNIQKATQAMRLMFASMGLNPFAVVAIAIGAVVLALNKLYSSSKQARAEISLMAQVQAEANKEVISTLVTIKSLTATINDNSKSLDERRAALKKLIAINPEYLGGLTLENMKMAQGIDIIKKHSEALKVLALLKAVEKRKTEEYEKMSDLELREELNPRDKKRKDIQDEGMKHSNIQYQQYLLKQQKMYEDFNDGMVKKSENTIEELDKIAAKAQGKLKDLGVDPNKINQDLASGSAGKESTGGGKKNKDDAARKAEDAKRELQRIRDEIEALNAEITAKEKDAEQEGKARDEQEIQRIVAKYQKLLTAAKQYTVESAQLTELQKRELELLYQAQFDRRSENEYAESLKGLQQYYQQRQATIANAYAAGDISQQEYAARSVQLEYEEATDRLTIANDYAQSVKKAAEDAELLKTEALKNGVEERKKIEERAQADATAIAQRKILTSKKGSLVELKAKKEALILEYEQAVASGKYTNEQLITMKEELNEKLAGLDKEYRDALVAGVKEAFGVLGQIMDTYFGMLKAREDAELARDRARNEKKKEQLDKQLERGLISRKKYNKQIIAMDSELDAKSKELQIKQAKREKAARIFSAVINTAAAVTAALTVPYVGAVLAVLYAALGAVQIAAIASEPLPRGRKGLVIDGPSHEANGITMVNNQTGRPIAEIEGGEPVMVLSKNTYSNNKPIIDELIYNSNNKNGAQVAAASWYNQPPRQMNRNLLPIMRIGGIAAQNQEVQMKQQQDKITDNSAYLQEMIREQKRTRAAIAQQQENLRAYVVLKDIEDKIKLRDKAKSLSGIKQKPTE